MARGRQLTGAEKQALRDEARGTPAGQLRAFAEEHAKVLGCHVSTVYRVIQPDVRNRKKRSDAGELKVMEKAALDDIGAMVVQYDYDAELAIDTYNANRVKRGEPEILVHPETVRRHLREMGVSRRHNKQDLRVHRRFEAPYPNYLFQQDSTVAQQYFIDSDDTIRYEAVVARNKNKPGNQKTRIWLLAGVDDYARVRWGRFYPGNSAIFWHDFMLRCWRGFADPVRWPAYGVPERFYSDQDSAVKSALVTRSLELLGVQRMLARPSTEHETNAQAKGKVEASIRLLQSFEKATRWSPFRSLEAMNESLLLHLIHLNNRPHSATGVAPFERWLGADRVVLLPPEEITRRMSFREDERRVASDITISLGGKTYQLPHRAPFIDQVGQKLKVLYLEADLTRVTVVIGGEEYTVDAVEALPDTAGEFKAAPVPAAVEKKRELQVRPLTHIDPHAVREYRVEKDTRLYPIRPKEVPHSIAMAALSKKMVPRGKAIDRAQKAGVIGTPPTREDKAAVDALFSGRDDIPENEVIAWIEARRDGRGGEGLRVERA